MKASSVDDAVRYLSEATQLAAREHSRWGYFAAMYCRVTQAVGERIAAGYFDDGERMERLDVAFANRYFDALDAHLSGREAPSEAWRVAFAACEHAETTVIQHLYLGLNAHLLLDLSIAAAATCPGRQLRPTRDDFHRINNIVLGLMVPFHRDLGRASPCLGRFDRSFGWLSAQCSIGVLRWVREEAWRMAEEVNIATGAGRAATIARMDTRAARVGRLITATSTLTKPLWNGTRREEAATVGDIILILAGDQIP